jgi:hypothetical protein
MHWAFEKHSVTQKDHGLPQARTRTLEELDRVWKDTWKQLGADLPHIQ